MSEVDKSCFPLHIVNVERGSFTLMKNGRAGGAGRGGRGLLPALLSRATWAGLAAFYL